MTAVPDDLKPVLTDLLLAVADDKLMLGHRNSDWTGLAPILEEDIAFSSLAQDEIAHAQALYELAGGVVDESADHLAFGRAAEAYRCAAIVEVPDDFDWAIAIARQLFCDHFDHLRLERLAASSWKPLADLARRLAAEEQVHVRHVSEWIVHLGRGTDESRERTQRALTRLAPLAGALFEPVTDETRLVEAGLYPGDAGVMHDTWSDALERLTADAGLTLDLGPFIASPEPVGGRHGHHTEHLAPLLDEMCEVYRIEPKAAW